jgi:aspartate racemase
MSWESSIEYERVINRFVRRHRGGVSSADLIIRSFDFADVEALQEVGDWEGAAELLCAAARELESVGAQAIVICTNTMHRVAEEVQAAVMVPVIHIADATARAVCAAGLGVVALLGTRYTMEQDFYADRLREHGLDVMVPDEPDRSMIHDVIYDELVRGEIRDESRRRYVQAIETLQQRGAEAVITGCTEIELLIGPDDIDLPFFPTARIHAEEAARFALGTD